MKPCLSTNSRLDQPGHAGAGFEVPDVGLDRSDEQRTRHRSVCGQRICERPDLDRIAVRGPGAVCLDVADFVGLDARSSQGCRDGRFLGFIAGYGDAVGAPVLRYRGTEDLRVDLIAIAQRLLQRLDDDDRATFSPRVPVGRFVEALQRPSGLRNPLFDSAIAVLGPIMMLTPPATARSHSPFQILSAARCTATSELEQAVSTVMLGPRKSKANEILFASIVIIIPVAEWVLNR